MSSSRKQLKMIAFVNHRMRITVKDGREIVGQMLGFDKHMNIVLADAEELRKIKRKAKSGQGSAFEGEEKRVLGLIILRGQEVVAAVMDGPPPADPSARLGADKPNGAAVPAVATPGISRPAGRGVGLQGPVAGAGGFAPPPFPGGPGFGRGFPPGGASGAFPPAGMPFPPGGRGFGPPGGFPPR